MNDKLFSKGGKGWFKESLRHSNAVKLGRAGPIYSGGGKSVGVNFGGKSYDIKPKNYTLLLKQKSPLIPEWKTEKIIEIPVVARNKKMARKQINLDHEYEIIKVKKGGKTAREKHYYPIFLDYGPTKVFVGSGHGRNKKEALKEFEKGLEAEPLKTWSRREPLSYGGGKLSFIEQSKSLPIGKYSSIPAKSIWVRTDPWRGYFTFKNSVADGWIANAMGDPIGESHNESERQRMIKIKSILRKNNISYETKHTRTSNIFSIGYDILVPPEDVSKAKKLLRRADLGGKKFEIYEKVSGLGYFLGNVSSKNKKLAERKLRKLGLKEIGVLEGGKKKITFERGRIHRARRDVLARRLEKVKGIETPYALATSMIKKGYGVKNGEVKREFAEQKSMMSGKRPRSLLRDMKFRKWLIEKKNIEPAYLLTLGTKSIIQSYRKEYLKEQESKKIGELIKKKIKAGEFSMFGGGKFNLDSLKRELKKETIKGSRQTKKGTKDFFSDVNDFMKFRKSQKARREFGELGIRYVGGKKIKKLTKHIITFGINREPTYYSFGSRKQALKQKESLKKTFPNVQFQIKKVRYNPWIKK